MHYYNTVNSTYKKMHHHSYISINYKENFKHGYKLISQGEILLQKFGYETQDQAQADALAIKTFGTQKERYTIAPVRSLNCYSVTLQHSNAQLIGFKSGFPNQEAAQAHVNYLIQVIKDIDNTQH